MTLYHDRLLRSPVSVAMICLSALAADLHSQGRPAGGALLGTLVSESGAPVAEASIQIAALTAAPHA